MPSLSLCSLGSPRSSLPAFLPPHVVIPGPQLLVSIDVWIYVWVSVPLINLSISVSVSCYVYYYRSTVQLDIGNGDESHSSIIEDRFSYPILLLFCFATWFHAKLKIVFPKSVTICFGILMGSTLNLHWFLVGWQFFWHKLYWPTCFSGGLGALVTVNAYWSHQENTNQNYFEVLSYSSQNG